MMLVLRQATRTRSDLLSQRLFFHRTPPLLGHRTISSSSCRLQDACATEAKAASETQGIDTMDRLLRVVRERSNPAYHSIMPAREPGPWSEALLTDTTNLAPTSDIPPPPPSQESMSPRRMHETYSQIVLPFASSPELFEQYMNASGGLRTGMLMEHLDSLAGSIAYEHMLGPSVETLGRVQERGFYIVTASVERLDMLASLYPVRDICLSGQVIYTGKSSMEVAVKMEALNPNRGEETLMLGRFSMVCRDARTHKARPVNPLIIDTPEEEVLYKMGESQSLATFFLPVLSTRKGSKNRRKHAALQALSRVPPSSDEAAELHATYLKCGQEDDSLVWSDRVWMGDTLLEKTMLMFPQERNVHQKVFGGYLMRLAYELGFANACFFMRSHVTFHSLDGISFTQPVPIGSILRLRSQILHTSPPGTLPANVHVRVVAGVVNVQTGHEETTNDFRFTWARDDGKSTPRIIVPKTYQEAMLWLEGKRALEMGAQIRGSRNRALEGEK